MIDSTKHYRPTQRAPEPRQSTLGLAWWESARFHLCLRQGAGKQFAWLEFDSVKVALSRPTHQWVLHEEHKGQAANRWAHA